MISDEQVMSRPEKVVYKWNGINWRKLERSVFKLQKRQASKSGDWKRMKRLQKLLLKSKSAKLLAVRRGTQINKGKKTAGIDRVKSLSPTQRLKLANELNLNEKSKPVRRIWIPKPGKSEKRPLGIPTMTDRARQALVKLALEPEWEAKFAPNTYGFRPVRSCHDAIEAIYLAIHMTNAILLRGRMRRELQEVLDSYNNNQDKIWEEGKKKEKEIVDEYNQNATSYVYYGRAPSFYEENRRTLQNAYDALLQGMQQQLDANTARTEVEIDKLMNSSGFNIMTAWKNVGKVAEPQQIISQTNQLNQAYYPQKSSAPIGRRKPAFTTGIFKEKERE